MAHFEKTKKENTFHLWDEYLYLLELLQKKHPENNLIDELLQLQIDRKYSAEISQERKEKSSLHFEGCVQLISATNLLFRVSIGLR